ncbi:MAG: hypothetical protein JWQ17_7050, partial [Tardiphaga sp.]|nr:hypothetical protein [Tardiphaga sp.]
MLVKQSPDRNVAPEKERHVVLVRTQRIAIGLIMLCTPPLKRGW